MNTLRIYLETSAFNYYFDEDRNGHEDVVKLFNAIKEGEYEGYTSRYTTDELMKASEPKRSSMLSLINEYGLTVLGYAIEASKLASTYIGEKIIPASQRLDSLHIAIATVYRLSCIISYNFHHINRDKTRFNVAIINEREGYEGIIICTAKEVLSNDISDF